MTLYNTDNVLVLFYFLTKEVHVTTLTGTGMKTKLYILNINEGDIANYLKILLFTFLFTLFVFASKSVQYPEYWVGPDPV